MHVADIQSVVASAIGGENIGETIENRQRFPINVRYPREYRDSLERLRALPIVTERGAQIRLADVARVEIKDGPPMLKSENGRLAGWVYVDVRGRDLRSAVTEMQQRVHEHVQVPAGYSIAWSGQFEYLERATQRLKLVVPATLIVIFLLLFLTFRSAADAVLIMVTVPFALAGGFWLIWILGHAVSVASAVGFIALAGVAAEFGVVMLIYLRSAWARRQELEARPSDRTLMEAMEEGAVLRVRPKAMTLAVIIAGLLPIMWSADSGSEVMQRIAAPMIGGMLTAPLLSLFVIPAAWLLITRRKLARQPSMAPAADADPAGMPGW